MIKERYPRPPVHILLDNLKAHHALRTKEYAESAGINLVFNAAYNSSVNPIERLWCYAKRSFQKLAVKVEDWKNFEKVITLVEKCLKGVKPKTL